MLAASPEENEANKKAIKEKRIIWVLGEVEDSKDVYVKSWQEMLQKIGVNTNDILLVDLQP